MKASVDALVSAPPDVVFAVVRDVESWPQFISAIRQVEMLTPGAPSIGSRFRETRTMFGRTATEEMTVAELDPPHRLVLTAFNHGTAYRAEHVLEAEGAGARLTLMFEGRPVSLAARLFAPLGWMFMGTVKRQLASDLADLKREAERRQATG